MSLDSERERDVLKKIWILQQRMDNKRKKQWRGKYFRVSCGFLHEISKFIVSYFAKLSFSYILCVRHEDWAAVTASCLRNWLFLPNLCFSIPFLLNLVVYVKHNVSISLHDSFLFCCLSWFSSCPSIWTYRTPINEPKLVCHASHSVYFLLLLLKSTWYWAVIWYSQRIGVYLFTIKFSKCYHSI